MCWTEANVKDWVDEATDNSSEPHDANFIIPNRCNYKIIISGRNIHYEDVTYQGAERT